MSEAKIGERTSGSGESEDMAWPIEGKWP